MKTFCFTVFKRVGTSHRYEAIEVTVTGASFAEALEKLTAAHPDHHVAEHLKGLWCEVVEEII